VNDVTFAAAGYLHVLWVVLAVAVMVAWLDRRATGSLASLVSTRLWSRLVDRSSNARRNTALLLFAISGAMLTVALMRPQLGLRFVRTPRVGAEIMICLDVSRSMLAEDVAPNRLERAKAEIRELLGYLSGDQVGLIAFAGRAAVMSPMTPDFGFLRLVLDEVGPNSVARGVTRLEEPIRRAVAGFRQAGDV
jgi:Ca-activated chloride channel family protein